jgi:hypothetical protein
VIINPIGGRGVAKQVQVEHIELNC